MTSATKPTVLFVHGSWHNPAHFKPIMDVFKACNFPVSCPALPTNGSAPTVNMYADAECTRSELSKLINDEGKDVVLVLHSYGGIVGTQAAHEDFSKAVRMGRGLVGGILRILYMCAFLLPLGDSLGSAFGGQLPPFIKVEVDGSCNMSDPSHRFYNDLPRNQQEHWVSELKQQPAGAQLTPLTYVAYKHHPVSYLLCENDEALPLEVQKMMVAGCGVDVQKFTCIAGHSSFLSQPDVVLEVVVKMIE